MKKFYTLFIVLFGSILFGQEYRPMLNENNVWDVQHYSGEGNFSDYQYTLSDELIIFNGKEYARIEFTGSAFADIYLHENINDRTVYAYYPESGDEYLLYDFNLEVGDDLPLSGFFNYNEFEEAVIEEITYENVFGLENIKTYSAGGIKIHEGIGTNAGLFTLIGAIDDMYYLADFQTTMSTSEENTKSKTKIYPNPFSDKIQIQNSEEIKELQLFDLQGKLISTNKNLDKLNSKLSSLSNAVYFLKIQFKNNKSETIKLIKNK